VLLYTRSLPPSSCTVVLQNSIEQLTLHRRSMNRYSYLASTLARNNLHNVPRNYPTTNHLNEIVFPVRQPVGGRSCARFWHLAPSRTQFLSKSCPLSVSDSEHSDTLHLLELVRQIHPTASILLRRQDGLRGFHSPPIYQKRHLDTRSAHPRRLSSVLTGN
jgi:hypothetical protein